MTQKCQTPLATAAGGGCQVCKALPPPQPSSLRAVGHAASTAWDGAASLLGTAHPLQPEPASTTLATNSPARSLALAAEHPRADIAPA